jgi:HAD superfamily hydrolase (TIGR01549 family)
MLRNEGKPLLHKVKENDPEVVREVKQAFRPDLKKIIFFDMNDTLVDVERTFDAGFKDIIREWTVRWDSGGSNAWSPEAILDKYKSEWNKRSKSKKSSSRSSLKQASLRAALAGTPITVSERFARHFFRTLKLERVKHAALLPGVKETVISLTHRYQIAIISNGSKDQIEAILERKGLLKYIPRSHIFASAEIGHAKPSSLLYQHALKTMGVKPLQAVMVGNSWRNDIMGAVRSGIDAIWLSHTNSKKKSQRKVGKQRIYFIRRFEQLRNLL